MRERQRETGRQRDRDRGRDRERQRDRESGTSKKSFWACPLLKVSDWID